MTNPVLTAEGREQLAARVVRLREVVLPDLVRAQNGPDRDPAAGLDYDRGIAELHRLESLLASAVHLEDLDDDPCVVELGDLVTLELDTGEIDRYLLVDPSEAPLDDQRISAESPLAVALLGRRIGEVAEVVGPSGSYRCRVLGATRRPVR